MGINSGAGGTDLLWLRILLGAVALVVFLAIVFLSIFLPIFFIRRHKKNAPTIEKKDPKSLKRQTNVHFDIQNIISYLGGLENFSELELHGTSRVFMKVKDIKIVDKEKLNSLGIRTLEMSEKLILVNEYADSLYEQLNSAK